jgi:hypothetical protein
MATARQIPGSIYIRAKKMLASGYANFCAKEKIFLYLFGTNFCYNMILFLPSRSDLKKIFEKVHFVVRNAN